MRRKLGILVLVRNALLPCGRRSGLVLSLSVDSESGGRRDGDKGAHRCPLFLSRNFVFKTERAERAIRKSCGANRPLTIRTVSHSIIRALRDRFVAIAPRDETVFAAHL